MAADLHGHLHVLRKEQLLPGEKPQAEPHAARPVREEAHARKVPPHLDPLDAQAVDAAHPSGEQLVLHRQLAPALPGVEARQVRGEAQRDAAGPAAQVLGKIDLHVRPQPPARLAPDEQLARAEDPVQRQEHALGVAAGRLGGPGNLVRELPGAQKQPLPPAGVA